MRDEYVRTAMLITEQGVEKLKNSCVAVFGVGGVGSYTVEALARCGVGRLVLVDKDEVALSNINRQMIALHSTVGQPKVEVAKQRINDINPEIKVEAMQCFFDKTTVDEFNFDEYDYVVDAIDSVSSKLLLIETAVKHGVKIISSMGMGNKLHPEMIELEDIMKTSVCPLARVMRTELRKRNIHHLDCVYSKEKALVPDSSLNPDDNAPGKRQTPGSVSFVPSTAGLIIASKVIRDIIGA